MSDFKKAVPIALFFAVAFVFLQKIGLINLISGGPVTYGTAFVVGIVASLSSCMAMVGGLVLSMSASYAKQGADYKPQILFHISRLLSFFILGGIVGSLGKLFTLTTGMTFALNSLVGIVMLLLGLHLLDIFSWTEKFQFLMPRFLSERAVQVSRLNHSLTPLFFGIATFFLPCGFTQSMQIYTLTTGSFMHGGLTMLAFALGTLPVLALVSFSSTTMDHAHKGVFFKSAGLIVIMFALFNLINSFVIIGLIPAVFNF